MKTKSKILIVVGALLLSAMYFMPLWVISLDAPQYPEGLGIHIWINKMTGANPHDLKNINNLNHYIGMKAIEPDSIPELKVMPWVVRFIMIFGIVTAVLGKKKLLTALLLIFMLMAVVGFIDYYMWGYDYGHNLDEENAIIKMPGQSYQPPLIGKKTILNFQAYSYPGYGGLVAILSFCLWVTAFWIERKKKVIRE